MVSSAAPERPPRFGGTTDLVQIALLIAASATTGSPVANCIHAPPKLPSGTGPFREEVLEKNAASASGGHWRMVCWMSMLLTSALFG